MKKIIPFTIAAALAASGLANAQAFSKPSGYVTETIIGKSVASDPDVFNLVGVPLQRASIKSGAVTAISSSELTDSNTSFSDVAAGIYLLEITSGAQQGFIQEVNSFGANSISLPVDLTGSVVAGDTYRVRSIQTLDSVFGAAADSSLKSGNLTTADIVWVSDGVGGFDRYFIAPPSPPFVPSASWTKIGGSAGAGATSIVYSDAVIVQRRGVGNVSVVVTGEVKTDLVVYPVIGATSGSKFNYYATPYPTKLSSTGSTSASDTTVASVGVLGQMTAGNLTTADVLWLPQGDGNYKRYILTPPAPPFKPNQTFDEIGGAAGIDPATLKMPSAFILQKRTMGGSITVNPPTGFNSL